MALSKNQIKYISSLHQKKHREETGQFIVEGDKIASELISQQRYKVIGIYAIEEWLIQNSELLRQKKITVFPCSNNDMERISALNSPGKVLFVLEKTTIPFPEVSGIKNLLLENIQDPGNLGTIIRTADWFGIENIFCSADCVELYNPKVLQATMGSFLRVNVVYTDLIQLLSDHKQIPAYAAVLNGKNVFETNFPEEMFLLIGNEGKGLTDHILSLPNTAISIPKFGGAESLNAAVATAILCAILRM